MRFRPNGLRNGPPHLSRDCRRRLCAPRPLPPRLRRTRGRLVRCGLLRRLRCRLDYLSLETHRFRRACRRLLRACCRYLCHNLLLRRSRRFRCVRRHRLLRRLCRFRLHRRPMGRFDHRYCRLRECTTAFPGDR